MTSHDIVHDIGSSSFCSCRFSGWKLTAPCHEFTWALIYHSGCFVFLNSRINAGVHGAKKRILPSTVWMLFRGPRDGPRFGQTEAGFCLRFGFRVNRIFGSETEDEVLRRSRAEHQVCGVNFFLGNRTHSCQWYPGHKKVFLIVPGHTTLVRKDGVPPISCWDEVLSPNRNYFYNTLRDSWRILRAVIFRSKGSASWMKTRRVKLSDDKLDLREASTWPATENKRSTGQDVAGVAK